MLICQELRLFYPEEASCSIAIIFQNKTKAGFNPKLLQKEMYLFFYPLLISWIAPLICTPERASPGNRWHLRRNQLWKWCFSLSTSSGSGVFLPYLPACCSPRCASPRATGQPGPSFSQNPWILWPSPQSAEHKPCTQRSAGCISSWPAAQFGGCPQDLQDKGQTQLQ